MRRERSSTCGRASYDRARPGWPSSHRPGHPGVLRSLSFAPAGRRRPYGDRERVPGCLRGIPLPFTAATQAGRRGRQRLPDSLRWSAAARREARRPGRPQAGLHRRPRRFGAVPAGPEPGGPDRRPLPAGHRGRADLLGDPGDDRDNVPGPARAGEGDRRLQLRRRLRRLARPARRRGPHRSDQLALDLLREPAVWPRRDGPRGAPDRHRRRHRPRQGRRRPRRRADHRRPHARRVHDRRSRRLRLGIAAHAWSRCCLARSDQASWCASHARPPR